MSNEVKYWIGPAPDQCDVCKGSFKAPMRADIMFDAVVSLPTSRTLAPTKRSIWANVCTDCFLQFGTGLGQGRGQKYEKQQDGRWLKVAG